MFQKAFTQATRAIRFLNFEYFYDGLKKSHPFPEGYSTIIYNQNKQFLGLFHEDD